MSKQQSYAFRPGQPGSIIDCSKPPAPSWDEPNAIEREIALGYAVNCTAAEGVTEQQRRAVLGQSIDANALRALLHFLTALVAVLCIMQSYQLLNCDDHANYLMKHKKDPALFRPDITHQVRPPPPSIYCHGIFHIFSILKRHTPGIHKWPHMGRQCS